MTFSAQQAAYLIKGIDPSSSVQLGTNCIQPILERMHKNYSSALAAYSFDVGGLFWLNPKSASLEHSRMLLSVKLDKYLEAAVKRGNEISLFDWIASDASEFESQYFSRQELHRWITENDLPSEYDFLKTNLPVSQINELSTTERNTLLAVIAALCDYSDIKYKERGAATKIAAMTQENGAPVSDDAIRNILKKIPDALATRMK